MLEKLMSICKNIFNQEQTFYKFIEQKLKCQKAKLQIF